MTRTIPLTLLSGLLTLTGCGTVGKVVDVAGEVAQLPSRAIGGHRSEARFGTKESFVENYEYLVTTRYGVMESDAHLIQLLDTNDDLVVDTVKFYDLEDSFLSDSLFAGKVNPNSPNFELYQSNFDRLYKWSNCNWEY